MSNPSRGGCHRWVFFHHIYIYLAHDMTPRKDESRRETRFISFQLILFGKIGRKKIHLVSDSIQLVFRAMSVNSSRVLVDPPANSQHLARKTRSRRPVSWGGRLAQSNLFDVVVIFLQCWGEVCFNVIWNSLF